jgi:hypothetical protein
MSARIEIPSPPEVVPSWAWNEARQWQNLSDFDILIKAEIYLFLLDRAHVKS